MSIFFFFFLLFASHFFAWDDSLPTLPSEISIKKFVRAKFSAARCPTEKRVPCHIWITSKSFANHQHIQEHVKNIIKRNKDKGWHTHLVDDEAMDHYMRTAYKGTQVLQAYNIINTKLGAAKADIWRIAVLWMYGGAYIDADADIEKPFDEV
jgi:mannosyltransferase OCH1-like enzyme